ncbi:hypothetical protein A5482_014895 (plasmid) [Cyanobacterium sp. IPPAS B-1200]|uniref:hypothetical protein n=1 Tax=Cyanobacterium sp. IPPAS B-1200 TaxID=1562720 RepID=UPI00085263EE|nr:hypothetical protein [Cyanobacterium sp. IPPAS B-1200]OEJ78378.1 hypothetical protein A5482_13515 [Cyanobacterium sp. IPPAS B-1200]
MSNLYEILNKIKEAPGIYLGRPSVSDLFMFLMGYEFARSEMDVDLDEEEELFYDSFQPWLQQRLRVLSVSRWAKLIMLSCHDEKAGFDKFFFLLDEFRQQARQQVA